MSRKLSGAPGINFSVQKTHRTQNKQKLSEDEYKDYVSRSARGEKFIIRMQVRGLLDDRKNRQPPREQIMFFTQRRPGVGEVSDKHTYGILKNLLVDGKIWDSASLKEELEDLDGHNYSDPDLIRSIQAGNSKVVSYTIEKLSKDVGEPAEAPAIEKRQTRSMTRSKTASSRPSTRSRTKGGGRSRSLKTRKLPEYVQVSNPALRVYEPRSYSRRKTGQVKPRLRSGNYGAYCPFVNDTEFDLRRIQIYRENEEQDHRHCLQFTIEEWALKTGDCKLMDRCRAALFSMITDQCDNFNTKHMGILAQRLNINIVLSKYMSSNMDRGELTVRNLNYPTKKVTSWPSIKIANFNSHYFINEEAKGIKKAMVRESLCVDGKRRKRTPKEYKAMRDATYLQMVVILFQGGKLQQLHPDSITYLTGSAKRLLTKTDEYYKNNFDAINLEVKEQVRRSRDPRVSRTLATHYWAGDCESTVGLTKRDPNVEEDSGHGDISPPHKLYLIGLAPVESDTEVDVRIFQSFESAMVHLVTMYSSSAQTYFRSMSEKDRRNYSLKGRFSYPLINIVCYFHNLRYDSSIIQNESPFFKVIARGTTIYEMNIRLKIPEIPLGCVWFSMRDSAKHLQGPLKSLPTAMGLPKALHKIERGIYYSYFSHARRGLLTPIGCYIQHRPFDYDNGRYFMSECQAISDVNALLSEIRGEQIRYSQRDMISPDELYTYYLIYDVLVLAAALFSYRENMERVCEDFLHISGIDALSFRTSASLAMGIMRAGGCYEGVYEYGGVLREYIMRAVRGGRCNVHEEWENKECKPRGGICDLDAVSLYASSIRYLEYVPVNAPVKLTKKDCNMEFLGDQEAAIVTVRITNCRKKVRYAQPIIASIDKESGILQYTQEITEPIVTTIHVIELSEYIKYHDIEFEILYGIFWPVDEEDKNRDDPVGQRWSKMMIKLHQCRLAAKKLYKETSDEKYNVQQNLLKLIGNSAYGKTITKMDHRKKHIHGYESKEDKEEAWKWIYNQWGELRSDPVFTDFNMIVDQQAPDDTFTFCMFGVACLAMSRSIMNGVFSAAEGVGAWIYYTDTDSLFFPRELLPDLISRYNDSRPSHLPELYGSEQGQFHVDFAASDFTFYPNGKLDQAVSYFPSGATNNDIFATTLFPIRKKLYLMMTKLSYQGLDYHSITFRGKGLTKSGILSYASDNLADLDFPEEDVEYKDPCQRGIIGMFKTMVRNNSSHRVCLNPDSRTRFIYTTTSVSTTSEPTYREARPRKLQKI